MRSEAKEVGVHATRPGRLKCAAMSRRVVHFFEDTQRGERTPGSQIGPKMQLAFTRDMLRREPAHAPVLPYTQEESMQAVNGLFLHALHSD